MCTSLLAQDASLERLENSPRHHEWVESLVQGKTLYSFIVYPERSDKAPVILVIHENRGLTDWVRGMADQLAELGYIAIAPDMLSESADGISKTSDYTTSDEARNAIYALEADFVTSALDAAFQYGKGLAAGNGNISVVGFCWGGSQTFRYATNNPDLKNAFVFYGTAPKEQAEINKIEANVYGFYGEKDNRVNATIEESEKMMKEAGKKFEYKIYSGAGHAYMRAAEAEDADTLVKEAAKNSIDRIVAAME
jgi:carboxymethylenebutenolidase